MNNDKWGISNISKKLGISNTNLVSFLLKEKRLIVWVNQQRAKNGMNSLK
jgi:phage antirepressor YoqD-like protein